MVQVEGRWVFFPFWVRVFILSCCFVLLVEPVQLYSCARVVRVLLPRGRWPGFLLDVAGERSGYGGERVLLVYMAVRWQDVSSAV
jgi:hypothetical protein